MNFLRGKTGVCGSIALIGAGTGLYYLWRYYTKREPIPTIWHPVGNLEDMMCFPIKSCGLIKLKKMECTVSGLRLGELRDRSFMIINKTGDFVTGRLHPRLVLVKPTITDNILTLEAPDMEPLTINMSEVVKNGTIKSTLWSEHVDSIDCGDNASEWLSRYILNEQSGLRLVHFPMDFNGIKKSRDKSIVSDKDSGIFPDLTSYCLINENSIKDLNDRVTDCEVRVENFRPNFVVKGPLPFEEDYWRWVKIGDVIFKVVKNCTRCIFTTVDSKTGMKNKSGEPLATLRTYRIIDDSKLNKSCKNKLPVMGIHLTLQKGGNVEIGDTVYIAH